MKIVIALIIAAVLITISVILYRLYKHRKEMQRAEEKMKRMQELDRAISNRNKNKFV